MVNVNDGACKDCKADWDAVHAPASHRAVHKRPAPHPGPRCATHHRAVLKTRRAAAQGRRLEQIYSITETEYQAMYAAQGGRCAICARATGKVRRLAVDHDHACCASPVSCGQCVRGLLCKSCNRLLGHARDDPEFFLRAADYLKEWPSGRGPQPAQASDEARPAAARAGLP